MYRIFHYKKKKKQEATIARSSPDLINLTWFLYAFLIDFYPQTFFFFHINQEVTIVRILPELVFVFIYASFSFL